MEENEKKLEEKEFVIERIIKYNEEIKVAERKSIWHANMVAWLGIIAISNYNDMISISTSGNYLSSLIFFAVFSSLSVSSVRAVINNLLKKTGLEISKSNLQDKYFIDDEEINFTLGKTKGKHC